LGKKQSEQPIKGFSYFDFIARQTVNQPRIGKLPLWPNLKALKAMGLYPDKVN
jgi:hypothetical protein